MCVCLYPDVCVCVCVCVDVQKHEISSDKSNCVFGAASGPTTCDVCAPKKTARTPMFLNFPCLMLHEALLSYAKNRVEPAANKSSHGFQKSLKTKKMRLLRFWSERRTSRDEPSLGGP